MSDKTHKEKLRETSEEENLAGFGFSLNPRSQLSNIFKVLREKVTQEYYTQPRSWLTVMITGEHYHTPMTSVTRVSHVRGKSEERTRSGVVSRRLVVILTREYG